MANKNYQINLMFNANVSSAQKELQKLSDSLQKAYRTPNTNPKANAGLTEGLKTARELESILRSTVNMDTGKLNLTGFTNSLKNSNLSVEKIYKDLTAIGPAGQESFQLLARSIANAETDTLSLNKKITNFLGNLKKVAQWEISSKAIHGLESTISNAYHYAQDLNESLNNIRIVTGQSTDQMAKFAVEANKAAKALNTTTTNYTDASLIYYQQGLSDQEVLERTDITIKMANVARTSAEDVSDQMTAVWNNFYDGSKSLEYYADVMTALGAATASSTEEISAGLNKFAAVAETVGLSYEYAASALATVTATTRQSADVVGTAFKTLFARIQDLKLGETLDDGTTLGSYSESLAKVGINIKNTNGEIKEMDTILEEMAEKWKIMDKDAQVALAQNVAGVRQYTQLIALMDNWDFFQENLQTSLSSTGTLNEQAEIYAESWEAAQKRVTASMEELYSQIINDEAFIKLTNVLAGLVDILSSVVNGFGGVESIITTISSLIMIKYAKEIPNALIKFKDNFRAVFGMGQKDQLKYIDEFSNKLKGNNKTQKNEELIKELDIQKNFIKNKKFMTEAQIAEFEKRKENIAILKEERAEYEKLIKSTEGARKSKVKSVANDVVEKQKAAIQYQIDEKTVAMNRTKSQKNRKQLGYELSELQQKKDTISSDNILNKLNEYQNKIKLAETAPTTLTEANSLIKNLSSANTIGKIQNSKNKKQEMNNVLQQYKTQLQDLPSFNEIFGKEIATTLNTLFDEPVEDLTAFEERLIKIQQLLDQIDDTKVVDLYTEADQLGKALETQGVDKKDLEYIAKTQSAATQLELQKRSNDKNINNFTAGLNDFNPSKFEVVAKKMGDATAVATTAFSSFSSVSNTFDTLGDSSVTAGDKISTLVGAIGNLGASAASLMTIMGPWGAVVAAVIAAITVAYKLIDRFNLSAEEAAENLQNAIDTLGSKATDTKNTVESLYSAFDNYTNATDALSYCVNGTEEWYNKLKDVQNSINSIFELVPKLKDSFDLFEYDASTGRYIINEEKFQAYLDKEEEKANSLNFAKLIGEAQAQAEGPDTIQNFVNEWQQAIAQNNKNNKNAVFNLGTHVLGYETTEFGSQYAVTYSTKLQKLIQQYSAHDIDKIDFEQQVKEILLNAYQDSVGAQYPITDENEAMIEIEKLWTNFNANLNDYIIESKNTIAQLNSSYASVATGIFNNSYENLDKNTAEWYRYYIADKIKEYSKVNLVEDLNNAQNIVQKNSELEKALSWYEETYDISFKRSGNWIRNKDGYKFKVQDKDGEKQEDVSLEQIQLLYASKMVQTPEFQNNIETFYNKIINNDISKDQDLLLAIAESLNGTVEALGEYFKNTQIKDLDAGLQNITKLLDKLNIEKNSIINDAQILINTTLQTEIGGKIKKEWLGDLGIDISNNEFTLGSLDNLATNFAKLQKDNNLFRNSLGEQIKEQFSNKITIENIDEINSMINKLSVLDTSSENVLSLAKEIFVTYDLLSEGTKNTLLDTLENLHQVYNVTTKQFEVDTNTIKNIIGDGLSVGDIISAEDFKTLTNLGLEIDKYFDITTEGTYKLNGGLSNLTEGQKSAQEAINDFNQEVHDFTLDKIIAQIQDYEEAIKQGESSGHAKGTLEYNLATLSSFDKGSLEAANISDEVINLIRSATSIDERGQLVLNTEHLKETDKALIQDAMDKLPELQQQIQITAGLATNSIAELEELLNNSIISQSVYNYIIKTWEAMAKGVELTKLEDIVDIYADINDELDYINHNLKLLQKESDKAYGQNKIKQLNAITKAYENQSDALQRKQGIIETALKIARTNIDNSEFDIEIDTNTGLIINEVKILTDLTNKLNEAEQNYINSDGEGGENSFLQQQISKYKEEIETVQNLINAYEKLYKERAENNEAIVEANNAILQNNYDQLKYALELNIEINDMELEELEFRLKRIEDDIYKAGEAAGLTSEKFGHLNESLMDYESHYMNLQNAYAQGQISHADYIEGLKEARSGIYDNLESLQELSVEMQEYYGKVLNMANEEIDKMIDRMSDLTGVLNHYKNIMSTLGKEQDYGRMNQILTGIATTTKNELESLTAEYEFYQQEVAEREAKLTQATIDNNKEAINIYKKQLEDAQTLLSESQDQMLSKTEEWAEAMKAVVENKLGQFGSELEKALTGGKTFEDMELALKRTNTLQEDYLTTTNKIYETEKMMRVAQTAIDTSIDATAKAKLKNFIQETKQLQEQGKLSKTELSMQQAKYDLLVAEIALQDAQNAKSTVRLKRDAEGNFGYVYTADQKKVNDALQNFEDAQNALYNIGLEGANTYSEKYQQALQEMHNTLTEINTAYLNGEIATQEEYDAKMLAAKEYYYNLLENYSDIYTKTLTADSNVARDAWMDDHVDMTKSSQEWMEAVDEYSSNASIAMKEWQQTVAEVETKTGLSYSQIQNSIKKVTEESNTLKNTLTDPENGLIKTLSNQMTKVDDVIDKYAKEWAPNIQTIIDKYLELANAIKNAITTESGETSGGFETPLKEPTSVLEGTSSDYQSGYKAGYRTGYAEGYQGKTANTNFEKSSWSSEYNNGFKVGYEKGYAEGKRQQDIARRFQTYKPNTTEWQDFDAYQQGLKGFDTGGYTGSWGPQGKLAVLHQKEIVLNANDTANLLASVDTLHSILRVIDLQSISSQLGGILTSPQFLADNSQTLEQQVTIEAVFPNATNHNEIEEAFNNIINQASQFANRK